MSWINEPMILACTAYFAGAATPGPNTALIATTTMRSGCRLGMANVFGVLCSSLVWGLVLAYAIAVSRSAVSSLTPLLQIATGIYLVCLSLFSIHSALAGHTKSEIEDVYKQHPTRQAFGQGLLVYASNPNAIITWIATVAIATPNTASAQSAFVAVIICWFSGVFIYSGYVFLFAHPTASAYYKTCHIKIYILAAIIFGATGFTLLSSYL